jgi:hypothetical protein
MQFGEALAHEGGRSVLAGAPVACPIPPPGAPSNVSARRIRQSVGSPRADCQGGGVHGACPALSTESWLLPSRAFFAMAMRCIRERACSNEQSASYRLERRRISAFECVERATTHIARMSAHALMRIWIDRALHSGMTCAVVLHLPQGRG